LHFLDTGSIIDIMASYIAPVLITVDPGQRHCGVAVWDPATRALLRAYLCGPSKPTAPLVFLDELPKVAPSLITGVIEMPQRYPGSPVKVETLIQLAAAANAVVGRLGGQWTQARPGTWTRQWCQDKAIRLDRAWKRLSAEEQSRVEMPRAKLRQADVLDAVALGLWALKR
jgi:hypothetical protein